MDGDNKMISLTGEQLAKWLGRLVQIPSVNLAHAGPRAGKVGGTGVGNGRF